MKRTKCALFLATIYLLTNAFVATANQPDSAYIAAYSTTKNHNHNGLHFAWSIDKQNWNSIGNEFRFLASDYGRWGAEKKMISPYLFKDKNQTWHCFWSLNNRDGVLAHAESKDLLYWETQTYPQMLTDNNCLQPAVTLDKATGLNHVTWISTAQKDTITYRVTTSDFGRFSTASQIQNNQRINNRQTLIISGVAQQGTIHKVAWHVIEGLINKQKLSAYNQELANENYKQDDQRFKGLKPLEATINANMAERKKISDMLIGVFFEDINYAADGGLYAELIQNRGFEYALSDKEGRDKSWTSTKAWQFSGKNGAFTIDTVAPIHVNNKHYAVLDITEVGAALSNEGFAGITVKEGDKYNFSAFVKNLDGKKKKLTVRLVTKGGDVVGEAAINTSTSDWKKVTAQLTATKSAKDAKLELLPQSTGQIALDMISLFPQNTFKGRKNGLRADLAQAIADLQPRFMRFPGGCVAHGDGIGNIYQWKNTIGKLEARKPQRNLWGYHQSAGLGYFEYLQYCEDMGAEPLPVIAAGVPCQNSATGGAGQQGGVAMCDMDNYIQDILDLVEYCNGSTKTTWGKKRAEAGHSKPFNLKYIGIGNEDLISDIFKERFTMIFNAIKKHYPEITVIGTVGPFHEGTDYVEGWDLATELSVPAVDEHYYESPGWFINNQNYYDSYDRDKSKVYLGEYASRGNQLYNALSEAIYLTAVERNADVVTMTSYAPLLAKHGNTQWGTDMIFFNNETFFPTPSYYVQKLYGQNSGDSYIKSIVNLSDTREDIGKRMGVSIVTDSKTGDIIVKLANLLPVEIKTTVNLDGAQPISATATLSVLTGNPSDKKAETSTSEISVSNNFTVTLSAYSFSVIRIKTTNNNN